MTHQAMLVSGLIEESADPFARWMKFLRINRPPGHAHDT
jgi:hypothetical protein